MKKRFAKETFLLLTSLLLAYAGSAQAMTINFDNTEVPGISNFDVVTNQWNSFGIEVNNAFYYVDSRDPFDGQGLSIYPINSKNIGRIDLLNDTWTDSMTIDWWTITGHMTLSVYNESGFLLDGVSGLQGSGTETLTGDRIAYMTWNDSGGYVQVSTLTFTPVPIPGALLLLGSGLVGFIGLKRRYKR